MSEFVVYTGPNANHDLETQRKIRSQAMRDFRRRQRSDKVITCLAQKSNHGRHIDMTKEKNRSERVLPRATLPTDKVKQPHAISGSSARDDWDFNNGDNMPLPTRPGHDSSAAFQTFRCRQDCSLQTVARDNTPWFDTTETQNIENPMPVFQYTTDPAMLSSIPLCRIPSPALRDTREEIAMQYFHDVVAKDVSGIVAVGFWERLVPQMCQLEDAARQAAIALSQAHSEQMERSLSLQNQPQGHSQSLSNLEAGIKASKALRNYIESSQSPSHELVLTCSIMLYTLESMLGRESSAALHLENGLKMFKAWQEGRKQTGSHGNETSHSLSTAFSRLDLSATIADDNRIPVFEYDDGNLPMLLREEDLVPHMSLTSSHDAHHQLMRIGTPAWAFLIQNQRWRQTQARFVPQKILEEQRMHRSRYRAWSIAMDMYESDRLYQSEPNRLASQQSRRAETMSLLATRMHHWCAKRMLEEFARSENDANVWDRSPHKALRYAKAIMGYTEEVKAENGNRGRTSFSPEIGICGILLCLAHRTALPRIREEALVLAQRFDRKEGARDLCGAFVAWTRLREPRPTFTFMMGEPGH